MIGKTVREPVMTTNDRYACIVLILRPNCKESTPLASAAIKALLPNKNKIHTMAAQNGQNRQPPGNRKGK